MRLTRFLPLALLSIGVLSCSPANVEPDAATWLEKWDGIVATVPDLATLAPEPDPEFCQSVLSELRTESEDLLPSPNPAVDALARDWVELAEGSFFECPPDGEEIGSFAEAYEEMERLEEAVADALSG